MQSERGVDLVRHYPSCSLILRITFCWYFVCSIADLVGSELEGREGD